jgi:hypothetical protein
MVWLGIKQRFKFKKQSNIELDSNTFAAILGIMLFGGASGVFAEIQSSIIYLG